MKRTQAETHKVPKYFGTLGTTNTRIYAVHCLLLANYFLTWKSEVDDVLCDKDELNLYTESTLLRGI